jgi:GAF domain-containing protein
MMQQKCALATRRADIRKLTCATPYCMTWCKSSKGASVLILDGQELQHAAAPGLPACYKQAVNGIVIGPHVGSCGTAAFRGHPIYVSDISTDPLWAPYSNIARMALEAGLRACWSVPIVSGGKVLGTFGLYHGRLASRPWPSVI